MSLPSDTELRTLAGIDWRIRQPAELSDSELFDEYDRLDRHYLEAAESTQERRLSYMMRLLVEIIERGCAP